MLVCSVIAFALVFHPLVAFGQTDICPKPRVYTTQGFQGHSMDLNLDGTCQKLDKE